MKRFIKRAFWITEVKSRNEISFLFFACISIEEAKKAEEKKKAEEAKKAEEKKKADEAKKAEVHLFCCQMIYLENIHQTSIFNKRS